jgi:uncharacterized RmlC-like cupin family protein
MTETKARARAFERSVKNHEDEYYVMRDSCYEPTDAEAWFVVSGTHRDRFGDELECDVVAAYCAGRVL